MIINHNMASLNTFRFMTVNESNTSKALEKLSSGLRINKAGDDAAGLAISEKMRAQIRGLDQASRNAQDGISMVQTAEGALNETHSILQRMRELAVQAGNDTNVASDREEIQKEINQLSSEINRIGNTTEFNSQKLLKGDGSVTIDKTGLFAGTSLSGGLVSNVQASLTVTMIGSAADMDGQTFTVVLNGNSISVTMAKTSAGDAGLVDLTSNSVTLNIATGTATAATTGDIADALNQIILNNSDLVGNYTATNTTIELYISATSNGDFAGAQGNIAAVSAVANQWNAGAASIGTTTYVQATAHVTFGTASAGDVINKGITINGQQIALYNSHEGAYTGEAAFAVDVYNLTTVTQINAAIVSQIGSDIDGVTLSQDIAGVGGEQIIVTANTGGTSGNSITVEDGGICEDFVAKFQVGANNGQSFSISISDMRSRALGLTGNAGDTNFSSDLNVTDGTSATNQEAALDVSDNDKAGEAVEIINDAIEMVSAERSKLGAYTNRLEHTIANLGTSSENLTAAESRIRDVDMAKEMMNFQKNNILQQAAQAMLAQANQQPQGVLQLLR